MFGGLHIEMAVYKALGKWLDGSGWTDVLADAGVATPGVSDSLVSASHLTRTRRAHQVTAAALTVLKQKAYAKCVDSSQERPREFEVWRKENAEESSVPLLVSSTGPRRTEPSVCEELEGR